jgi:hypothetical protein
MKKIGIVTCKAKPLLTPADQLLIPLFESNEIHAIPVVWNDPEVKWQDFGALLIRSVWDYHTQPDLFLNWLNSLETLSIKVYNPVSLIKANSHKWYLKKLSEYGIPTIPTL